MSQVGAGTDTATIVNNILESEHGRKAPIPRILSLGFATNSPPRLDHLVVVRRHGLTPATATPIMDPYVRHVTVLAAGAFVGGVLMVVVLGLALHYRKRRLRQRATETDVVIEANLDYPKTAYIGTSDQALLLANEETMCQDLTTVLMSPNGGDKRRTVADPEKCGGSKWLHRSMSWPGGATVTAPVQAPECQSGGAQSSWEVLTVPMPSAVSEAASCRDFRRDSWPPLAERGGVRYGVRSVTPASTYPSQSVGDPVKCTSTYHKVIKELDESPAVMCWDNFTASHTCDLMNSAEYNSAMDRPAVSSDMAPSSRHLSVAQGAETGFLPPDVSLTCFASLKAGDSSDSVHCGGSSDSVHCEGSSDSVHCGGSRDSVHCEGSSDSVHCGDSSDSIQWTRIMSGSMASEFVDSGFIGMKMEATSKNDRDVNSLSEQILNPVGMAMV